MQERFKEFTVLVANINRSIYKIKTEEMAEFHLKSSHVSCLYYIYIEDSLTAKELCDVCGEDKANISRAVKYLENNGYLCRNTKLRKRYHSPLELTEKGRKIGKYIADKIDNILDYASAGLSEEYRQIMYRSLNLINDNLNKLCESYERENR
ncbi:MAG: MarR family winged helix-turn-helix transcriptional regulator [Candidatus Scatosoma sp.]